MLLHGRQNVQIPLKSLMVIIVDVVLDHSDKFFSVSETSSIVTFSFQNAPEPFHRSVIDAVRYSRHALRHPGILKFGVKHSVCVLKPSVTVKERMSIRIRFYSRIKCRKGKKKEERRKLSAEKGRFGVKS